ncbi:MAG: hypothetical protein HYV02_07475 [Deltaproteobacteria bacterium]|nr:hypothetical protein [Deltaproteobacteria bacterium]MBI2974289.1 hypothetical protein [Deltaproteobacteria bacterium]
MQEVNYITLFTAPLDRLHIPYMITGSMATILYGEPRLTHDIDMVLALPESAVTAFLESFPQETFYSPPRETVLLELRRTTRAHFNLIHHASGFKADCYLASRDPLHQWGLQHRRAVALDTETTIWVAPPEYVIIRKLEYYREGESAKHLEDIRRMLPHLTDLDRPWLEAQLSQRGCLSLWHALQR